MTASYHLIVPLPAGRLATDPTKGRLSVYFVPRLQTSGKLTDWNDDWRNWPKVIDGTAPGALAPLRLTVAISGTVALANQNLQASSASWVSPVPSADAWTATFGTASAAASIGVDRFSPVYRDTMEIAPMYDATELSARIEALHQALAAESPDGPPSTSALSSLEEFGNLQDSEEIANYNDHLEPLGDGDVTDEETPEEADFHQALTFIQSHPQLMRTLGLVVDLHVALPPAASGDMTVSVASNYLRPDAEAIPLIIEATAGFWPSDGPGHWADIKDSHGVSQVDIGTGVSISSSLGAASATLGGGDTVDVAPLSSAGLYLARAGKDLALEITEQWVAQAEFEDKIYDYFDGLASLPLPIGGDLLTVGRRYDVWDETVQDWFSLWNREVPGGITFPRDPALTIVPDEDEGWMTYTASTEQQADVRGPTQPPGEGPARKKEDHTSIRINPIVFSWRGWSLAAAPPGRAFSGLNGAVDPEANEPSTDMAVKAVVDYEVPDGVLPRLRYTRQYKFRARTVDYAGNSRALTETHPAGDTETPLIRFGRQSRLASPETVRRVRRPVPGWGDTPTTLVIRSVLGQDPETVAPTSRVIFPGRTSQYQCELHGFPALDGLFTDPAVFADMVARTAASIDDHTQPALGTGDLLIDGEAWHTEVDYLTEPGQSGFAFADLPTASSNVIVPVDLAWPQSQTTSIELRAGEAAPVVDPDAVSGPAVVAAIPVGLTRNVAVSGTIDLALANHWSLFQSFSPERRAELEGGIGEGQHWMFSQAQELTVVHAVQQPLSIPAVAGTPTIDREPGKTQVWMSGTFAFDVKSTDRVKVTGTWTDPIDTPGAPGGVADRSSTRVLFNQREAYQEVAAVPISEEPFEVGDTKRHEALLSLEAFSRYARYFTERKIIQFPTEKTPVTLAPVGITTLNLDVQSSGGTARTGADFTVDPIAGTITRTDDSNLPVGEDVLVDFIRRPINRMFDEAGAPAVPFRIPHGGVPASIGVVEALPAFARLRYDESGVLGVSHEGQTVRVWLRRPWFTTGVGELLGVLVGSSDEGPLSQLARDPLSSSGPDRDLQLSDFSQATRTRSGLLGGSAEVAGHEVSFDEDRQLWFADIVIAGDLGYRPFVKLALVRYQPESINGSHIGTPVLTAPIRLGASRQCEVERDGDDALVTVYGQELGNEVSAWFQESDPAIADSDLSWNDLTDKVILSASVGATETVWSAALALPTSEHPVRLVVEDAEILTRQRPTGPNEVRNVAYVDTIAVPADWTATTPTTTTTTPTTTTSTTTTTVPGEGGPGRIEDLDAKGGDEAVLLTWTAPDDGGAPLTGYRIERMVDTTWTLVADLPDTRTKYVVRDLTNGDTYEFRVRASNADEDGPWSNPVAAVPDVRAPGKVRRLRAVTGGGLVRLRWRAAADRGSPVLGYRIERRLQGGDWGSPESVDAGDTTFTVEDETAGSVVGFRVRGVNAVGPGAWSNVVVVTVDGSGAAPDQVHGVALTPGAGELTVTWLPAGDNGAPLIRYDVQLREAGGAFNTTTSIDPDQLVHVVEGLVAGTSYEARVRAVNVVGQGDWSTIASGSPS